MNRATDVRLVVGRNWARRSQLADDATRVRTPLFPPYSEVRQLLTILEGVPMASVTSMRNAIFDQTGTPQNPVD